MNWQELVRSGIRQAKSRVVIASPDVDGLLCAQALTSNENFRLGGLYTTSWLILFDDTSVEDAMDGLWVDHDVFHPRIINFGQHLINITPHDTREFQSEHSFNPNELYGQTLKASFTGIKGKKQDKYPFGTIHYLLAATAGISVRDDHGLYYCLAHADGTWANMIKYPVNCHIWANKMFELEELQFFNHLCTEYGEKSRHLAMHQRLVADLLDAGIERRGSQSSGGDAIPPEWRCVQGHQGLAYRKGQDPGRYLDKLNAIIAVLTKWSEMKCPLPNKITTLINGVTDTAYPNRVAEQGLANFMKERRIFSHAIKGFREIRFTEAFLGH